VKKGGTRYSPKFKFRVVLEALKAEGKGTEAQVARAYTVSLVALVAFNECYRHASPITHHGSICKHFSLDYRPPIGYLVNGSFIPETLAENRAKSGSAPWMEVHDDYSGNCSNNTSGRKEHEV